MSRGRDEQQAKLFGRVVERVRSDRREVLAALMRAEHEALQPRVFELFAAPELRQRRAMRWKQSFGGSLDRMHIEQRAVRVEDHRIDGKTGAH